METMQLREYIAVGMLGLVALLFAAGTLVASVVVGKRGKNSAIKDTAYECGMLPVGPGNTRLSVKFYLVAMLFILFDVEAVFLYPWAILLKELKMFGFWEMVVYIAIVLVGLFYIWKKGALDWNKPARNEVL